MTYPMSRMVLACSIAAATLYSHAADLHVPIAYPTIQSAINAASNGDSVVIQPGVYNENINIGGKNITVKVFNKNFDTVINGGQNGPTVTFSGAEGPNCRLSNLVITNGKAAQGGGIRGNHTMANIRNCTIISNEATGDGGGIHGVAGLIENCTIAFNTASNGGGVAACDGTLDGNTIENNEATNDGGGIYDSPGIIISNRIRNNEAKFYGGGIASSHGYIIGNTINNNSTKATGPVNAPLAFGGAIADAEGTVTKNLIRNNESAGDGGGISSSTGLIQNNVIISNSARRGGGLASSNGRIENNTIWGNTAQFTGGGAHNLGPNCRNLILFANIAPADMQWSGANVPTYSAIENWLGGQPDIITASPQFINAGGGDFRLQGTSPCVDAGGFVADLTDDFAGTLRPHDGTPLPVGDGSDIDIGAFEFIPSNIDLSGFWNNVQVKYKKAIPKLKTTIKGQFTVTTAGTDGVTAPFGVQFYLSNDAILDPGDPIVGKTITIKKLKPGKSKKTKCTVKMPLNTPVTGQYLIVAVDHTNTTAELNESNNIHVYGPLP